MFLKCGLCDLPAAGLPETERFYNLHSVVHVCVCGGNLVDSVGFMGCFRWALSGGESV